MGRITKNKQSCAEAEAQRYRDTDIQSHRGTHGHRCTPAQGHKTPSHMGKGAVAEAKIHMHRVTETQRYRHMGTKSEVERRRRIGKPTEAQMQTGTEIQKHKANMYRGTMAQNHGVAETRGGIQTATTTATGTRNWSKIFTHSG